MLFTPLCSPDFLAKHGPIEGPADLLRLPRLDAHDDWWRIWCEAAGFPEFAKSVVSTISLDVQAMLGSAAMAGQGVAMLTPALFAADIAAGRLVQPFKLTATDGTNYWVAYAQERQNSKKIRAFRDWVLAEAARDEAAAAA